MPDRAVVECPRCGSPHPVGMEGDSCMAAARVAVNQPAPRAVVAISPDRQWLVVLLPEVHKWRRMWAALRCTYTGDYKLQETIEDTGQSADAVLDAFLKQRGS